MKIAWTTVETPGQARELASATIEQGLAACVQISGPVESVYRWKGKIETASEWRLTFKCTDAAFPKLESFILRSHPYETPEWLAVNAAHVGEAYLRWAKSSE